MSVDECLEIESFLA